MPRPISTVSGDITEYSGRPGTRHSSTVQAIEAMDPVMAWPSLRTESGDQSASEAAPTNLET
jgi:hypothetical protein